MFDKLTNPIYRRLFFLSRLPMALIAGLKVVKINDSMSSVSVPFKYWTKNPFKSTYFACLAMAGEFAGGILVARSVQESGHKMSMLVIGAEIEFVKKATQRTIFNCEDGKAVQDAIHTAAENTEGAQVVTTSVGQNLAGEEIAKMRITWSIRKKNP